MLYWVLPALQPAITLFVSALGLFIIALAATAALHHLPYVAPLLLLPALWLGLLTFSLLTGALLKWVLLGRGQPTSYAKYSWAFQSKAINASVFVSASALPPCPIMALCLSLTEVPPVPVEHCVLACASLCAASGPLHDEK